MRILYALILLLIPTFAFSAEVDTGDRSRMGWSFLGERAGLTNADTLMARPLNYAHLPSRDSLKLVVDDTDTVRVRMSFILADSTRRFVNLTVNGTDTAHTTLKPLFLESILIDSGQTLTDTLHVLKAIGDTPLTKIYPYNTTDHTAQLFLTKDLGRVTLKKWSGTVKSSPDTVDFAVKYYRNWEDARTYGRGMSEKVDELSILYGKEEGSVKDIILSNIPHGRGWIAVFGNARTAGAEASATLTIEAADK